MPPIVAITMGDAAGVGPEIVVKSLARPDIAEICRPVVIGDVGRLTTAARLLGAPVRVRAIATPASAAARHVPNAIDCIQVGEVREDLAFGRLSPAAGEAAFRYLERAVALAMTREIDAICTAPINKEALHLAGHRYPGHTEILAALTGTPEVSMLLSAPGLRVVHCTTHIGLLDAIDRIDAALVERTIRRGHEALVRWGIESPRIAVCGINPHAGESGLFGRGKRWPRSRRALPRRVTRVSTRRPTSADTVLRAVRGDFDLVVHVSRPGPLPGEVLASTPAPTSRSACRRSHRSTTARRSISPAWARPTSAASSKRSGDAALAGRQPLPIPFPLPFRPPFVEFHLYATRTMKPSVGGSAQRLDKVPMVDRRQPVDPRLPGHQASDYYLDRAVPVEPADHVEFDIIMVPSWWMETDGGRAVDPGARSSSQTTRRASHTLYRLEDRQFPDTSRGRRPCRADAASHRMHKRIRPRLHPADGHSRGRCTAGFVRSTTNLMIGSSRTRRLAQADRPLHAGSSTG